MCRPRRARRLPSTTREKRSTCSRARSSVSSRFLVNMSELSELYQQVILDHNKKPRNFRKLETANHTADGYNPLCGDQLTVYLDLEGGLVKEVGFEGSGCAISKA